MNHANAFLANLSLVLGVAALTTVLFQKIRQPVVFGYLIAGMIVGPHVPIPLFADPAITQQLAELGMILLMFSIGLEVSIGKLIKLTPTAGIIAILQCGLMIWLGYVVGIWLGWTPIESLYGGAIIAISSTTIIAKVFEEWNIKGHLADIVYGILIIEDVIAILILALFPVLSSDKGMSFKELSGVLGSLSLFLVGFVVVGMLVVPRLIRTIMRMNRPETTTIVSVGLCFILALLAKTFGYSVALGAFLAGALVAESGEQHAIERLIRPVKDIFSAVFFVAVGMLINPDTLFEHWGMILIFVLLAIIGKFIGVSVSTFLTGYDLRTSVKAGMSLAQIGEFSFIIAGVGVASRATGDFIYSLAVAVSAVTTLTTPWMIRSSDAVASYVDRKLPKPLQIFTSLYGSWMGRIRQPKQGTSRSRTWRFSILLLTDFMLLIAIMLIVSRQFPAIRQYTSSLVHLPEGWISAIVIIFIATLALPFFIGIIRCSRGLALSLSGAFLPPRGDENTLDLAAAPRKAFVVTMQLGILFVTGFTSLILIHSLIPLWYGVGVFLLILLIFGIIFWRSAASLQGHVTAGAQMILEILSSHRSDQHSDLAAQIEKTLPGLGNVASMKLSKGDKAVGKTLSELNLRGLTGASVIAIKRGEKDIATPSAHEKLLEGDVLVMTGSEQSIVSARELLT